MKKRNNKIAKGKIASLNEQLEMLKAENRKLSYSLHEITQKATSFDRLINAFGKRNYFLSEQRNWTFEEILLEIGKLQQQAIQLDFLLNNQFVTKEEYSKVKEATQMSTELSETKAKLKEVQNALLERS